MQRPRPAPLFVKSYLNTSLPPSLSYLPTYLPIFPPTLPPSDQLSMLLSTMDGEHRTSITSAADLSDKAVLLEGLVSLLPRLSSLLNSLTEGGEEVRALLDRQTHIVSSFHGLTQAEKLHVISLQLLAVNSNEDEPLSLKWLALFAAKIKKLIVEGQAHTPPARAPPPHASSTPSASTATLFCTSQSADPTLLHTPFQLASPPLSTLSSSSPSSTPSLLHPLFLHPRSLLHPTSRHDKASPLPFPQLQLSSTSHLSSLHLPLPLPSTPTLLHLHSSHLPTLPLPTLSLSPTSDANSLLLGLHEYLAFMVYMRFIGALAAWPLAPHCCLRLLVDARLWC